ncbi:MAG: HAD family phosphatase [Ruminococcaceae bacterium]|jgi:HAD superfamily hydrolase (TIGR01509 family)|nr:HAD family phosphatase [Oscillospiraceae bacterium]
MSVQAVLFDMDGLMFDTERLADGMWIETGANHGFTITPSDVAMLRGVNRAMGKKLFMEHFGEDFPYDMLLDETVEKFTASLAKHVPLRPYLMELLTELEKRGIPTAVGSSTNRVLVEQNLRVAGVEKHFQAIVAGDEVKNSKPAPEVFLKCAEKLGADPANCIVLEDSYNGIRAGHAAGCKAIMIPDMDPPTPEMEQLAFAILPSLREVIDFI